MTRADHSADNLNPYATPLGLGEEDSRSYGVGVWRDGELLVMHELATLPQICVKTGQPAEREVKINIDWTYPIDWYQRTFKVLVPLSQEGYVRFATFWPRVQWVAGASMYLCAALFFIGLTGAPKWIFPACFGGGILSMIMLFVASNARNQLLKFERHHQNVFWLRGAKEPFLAQLPVWPGSAL